MRAGTSLVTLEAGNSRLRKFREEAGGIMTSAASSQKIIAKPGYLFPSPFSVQSAGGLFKSEDVCRGKAGGEKFK